MRMILEMEMKEGMILSDRQVRSLRDSDLSYL